MSDLTTAIENADATIEKLLSRHLDSYTKDGQSGKDKDVEGQLRARILLNSLDSGSSSTASRNNLVEVID